MKPKHCFFVQTLNFVLNFAQKLLFSLFLTLSYSRILILTLFSFSLYGKKNLLLIFFNLKSLLLQQPSLTFSFRAESNKTPSFPLQVLANIVLASFRSGLDPTLSLSPWCFDFLLLSFQEIVWDNLVEANRPIFYGNPLPQHSIILRCYKICFFPAVQTRFSRRAEFAGEC